MFYLFHGKDTYSQREVLAGLLSKEGDADMLALNTTRLGGKATFAEIQSACDAVPFLARVRVVIVEDLFAGTPDRGLMDKLEAYLPNLPTTTRLFFLESGEVPGNHRILTLAGKTAGAYVRKFEELKGGALEKWIRDHTEAAGGRIAPQAAHLLAANVGADLPALGNEIEKLLTYVGPGGIVGADDVVRLSPYVAEVIIFDLVDALGNRQSAQLATLFQQKIDEGADPFYLFTMFIRQFRLLIQTRALLDEGERPAGIAEKLKQRPFVAEKLARQARGFTLPQLEHIYRRLLQIDVETKTGQADLLTALHLLVAGVTVEQ